MKVAIIGGGFTGLTAGINLVESGDEVVVFEGEMKPGGLAIGFSAPGWGWNLERFYHHIFYGDKDVREIAEKVGCPAYFTTPKTNSFIEGEEKQLDSPTSLLKFDKISIWSRIQMGLGLALLKVIPNGRFLEKMKLTETLPKLVGRSGYEKVWEPLLSAKFGPYLPTVNMAWFWARVYKRTQSLGYFEGGFLKLAEKMGDYLVKRGGVVKLGYKVKSIKKERTGGWRVDGVKFDKVLITTPAPLVDKLVGKGIVKWPKIDYLWAQVLVLELKKSLMKGYWLNILEKSFPFLVAVEHTNFADKKHYGNNTVVYLGNYLPAGDRRLAMDDKKLLSLFTPYIKKVNSEFEASWVKRSWLFDAPFAQPVFPVDYSKVLPPIKTEIPGLYVANMSMVYPFDRGTNFAVELGNRAAVLMRNDK